MKKKQYIVLASVSVLLALLGLTIMIQGNFYNRRPTPSPTPTSTATTTATVTSLPDGRHIGVMNTDAECFDWDYEVNTTFTQQRVVHVLGRNEAGNWNMVRGLTAEDSPCWVRAVFVNPDNYEPAQLDVLSKAFPPATPTPTPSPVATSTATASYTPTQNLPGFTPTWTATPTRTPRTRTPTPTFTSTTIIMVSPSDTPTSSATPTNTLTQTHTPTATATASPTNTPTKTLTPKTPDTPCLSPEVPVLTYTLQGQKVTLNWQRVDAARYEVYKAVESGEYALIGTTTGTGLEDQGLHPNVTYHYYVVAIRSCGEKSTSRVVDVNR